MFTLSNTVVDKISQLLVTVKKQPGLVIVNDSKYYCGSDCKGTCGGTCKTSCQAVCHSTLF